MKEVEPGIFYAWMYTAEFDVQFWHFTCERDSYLISAFTPA